MPTRTLPSTPAELEALELPAPTSWRLVRDVVAHGLIAATPGDTIDLRTGDIKPNNPADLVHMGSGGFLSEKRAQEKPAASFHVFKPELKFRGFHDDIVGPRRF